MDVYLISNSFMVHFDVVGSENCEEHLVVALSCDGIISVAHCDAVAKHVRYMRGYIERRLRFWACGTPDQSK